MLPVSFATSVPDPIAIPKSAFASAGASFIPSLVRSYSVGVAFSPNGAYTYVTNSKSNTVSVLST